MEELKKKKKKGKGEKKFYSIRISLVIFEKSHYRLLKSSSLVLIFK